MKNDVRCVNDDDNGGVEDDAGASGDNAKSDDGDDANNVRFHELLCMRMRGSGRGME